MVIKNYKIQLIVYTVVHEKYSLVEGVSVGVSLVEAVDEMVVVTVDAVIYGHIEKKSRNIT